MDVFVPTVTPTIVLHFKARYSDKDLVVIAEEIIKLGTHPLRYRQACKPSHYNYLMVQHEWVWLGRGHSVYWRLQRLVAKVKKQKELKVLSHSLQRAKCRDVENAKTIAAQRALLGELRPLGKSFREAQMNYSKVTKARDLLATR